MSDSPSSNLPLRLSIAALFILGLIGGTPVFVPAPQAYIIAAAMYAMSCLAMLALLRSKTTSLLWAGVAVAGYVVLAWVFVRAIGPL